MKNNGSALRGGLMVRLGCGLLALIMLLGLLFAGGVFAYADNEQQQDKMLSATDTKNGFCVQVRGKSVPADTATLVLKPVSDTVLTYATNGRTLSEDEFFLMYQLCFVDNITGEEQEVNTDLYRIIVYFTAAGERFGSIAVTPVGGTLGELETKAKNKLDAEAAAEAEKAAEEAAAEETAADEAVADTDAPVEAEAETDAAVDTTTAPAEDVAAPAVDAAAPAEESAPVEDVPAVTALTEDVTPVAAAAPVADTEAAPAEADADAEAAEADDTETGADAADPAEGEEAAPAEEEKTDRNLAESPLQVGAVYNDGTYAAFDASGLGILKFTGTTYNVNDLPATEDSAEDTAEPATLYDRLMACETLDEVNAILDNLTEAEEAEMDAFTEEQNAALTEKMDALGAYGVDTLEDSTYTIAPGGSKTVSKSKSFYSYSFVSYTSYNDGISVVGTNSGYEINVNEDVVPGTYTLTVNYTYKGSITGNVSNESDTITVIVTSSGSSSGGTTTITPGNRYYHLDIRVAAKVNVTVYDENGNITTNSVEAQVSNPTAKIYNTGSKTWSSSSGTDSTNNLKYWDIGFNSKTSSDNGSAEYMQNSPDRQKTEFYNGDTAVLTYTLTYTLDGVTHTVPVEISYVFLEKNNQCNEKDSDDKTKRGFDYVASVDDVTTAFSTSQLQISKAWNDNNNSKRPDSITVKVYQTVNDSKKEYMSLELNKDKDKSTYTMASGITKDEDMKVTFSNNYGVSIVGLPANHWVSNNGTYTYESCKYSVEEVLITDASGTISPVYGSFVYVDNTVTNSYVIAITNTLSYEKLAVKKEWADSENVDHNNDSVKVKLTAYYGENQQVPDDWLASFIGGSIEVTLSNANNWYQVFGYMPVYYTDGSENYAITAFKIEETEVTVDNGETYTATYSAISTDKDANGNYYFTVTNTPKPKNYELTVIKTLSGNMYNENDTFDFTVTYGETTETFKLGNNGEKTISVPVGAEVTVTENPGSYTYNFVSIEPSNVTKTNVEHGIEFTMPESNVKVTINNDYTVTLDTGVSLDSLPYILILGVVAVGAVVIVVNRRKHRRDY